MVTLPLLNALQKQLEALKQDGGSGPLEATPLQRQAVPLPTGLQQDEGVVGRPADSTHYQTSPQYDGLCGCIRAHCQHKGCLAD